jgi:hypothetical protein
MTTPINIAEEPMAKKVEVRAYVKVRGQDRFRRATEKEIAAMARRKAAAETRKILRGTSEIRVNKNNDD